MLESNSIQNKKANFKIGDTQVFGDLVLAPMDGFSDHPFRTVSRIMGAAFTFSEFINAFDVPHQLKDFDKRIYFTDVERPIGLQIYGQDPDRLLEAALILQESDPDFIDLNLGCAVRRVSGRGAGSGLLKTPKKIAAITKLLVKNLHVPLTAKIRLGWDAGSPSYLETAQILEANGVSMLSVHGRYRNENWRVPAHWELIAQIKKAVSIPVIGNGDISHIQDIECIQKQTGCDAVMIGRGSIGNPWIFSRTEKNELSRTAIIKQIQLHWELMQNFYGIEKAATLFKKHLKAYLSCEQFADIRLKEILRSANPVARLLEVTKN